LKDVENRENHEKLFSTKVECVIGRKILVDGISQAMGLAY